MATSAKTPASSIPAITATAAPVHGPHAAAPSAAARAPVSMTPSSPRFITPERWATVSPVAASRSGVATLTEAARKLREALDLQAAPQLATDRAWTMHALAAVERDRAHLSEALELLTRSLELHRAGESVHGEAWAHFQLGQYEEAKAYLERAAVLQPEDAVIFEHLGDVYLALGRREMAQQVYRRCLDLGDDNAEAVRRKLEGLDGGS